MQNSINKSISKAGFLFISLSVLYVGIQFSIYFLINNTINESQKISSAEKNFYIIANNIADIESTFLNYYLKYLPSSKRLTLLLRDGHRLLDIFFIENPTVAQGSIFIKLNSNYTKLHSDILKFLTLKDMDSKKEILLKEINESFFINRLLLLKQKNILNKNEESKISKIENVLSFNLITMLLLSIMIAIVIFYSIKIKKMLINKIISVQNSIRMFSKKNLMLNNLKLVEYKDNDEFKIIFDTFNQMIITISSQHNQLLLREKKYRLLFDNSSDALTIANLEEGFIDCNPAALKIFGFDSFEKFISLSPAELSPEYQPDGSLSSAKAVNMIKKALKEGTNFFEWTHKKENGDFFEATVLLSKIEMDNKTVVFATVRDITKQKQDEERNVQFQKMASIGTLAGGVAHDFNNMLGGIMGAAQLLKSPKRNLDEKGKKYVTMILQATTRAADLTAKLLAFGRKGKIQSMTLDVHLTLDDTVNILSKTIDKKTFITMKKNAKDHIVTGDNSGLQNALMNLIINASQAMPDGGNIQIETKNIILDKIYCDTSPFEIEPGNYIEITVHDTGCGIAPENIKKVFEPFFTTKEQGKGTGLGLAAVYGMVMDHHGVITVYSELNEGTMFYIFLPCSKEETETINTDNKIVSGSGTILFVDDEELIRITGEHMLIEMGYNVLLAENGFEAVEIFKEKHTEINLVIMDMIMPVMNGREAFFRLKEIDESCKIIITSGFTKGENLNDLNKSGLTGFIHKPFKDFELSQLLTKIFKGVK